MFRARNLVKWFGDEIQLKTNSNFPPESNLSSDVFINLVQEFLRAAKTFFNDAFLANSLHHSTSLRLALEFFKASTVTQKLTNGLKLFEEAKDEIRVKTLIFLCRVYTFGFDETLSILKHCGQGCCLQFFELSNKDNLCTRSDLQIESLT